MKMNNTASKLGVKHKYHGLVNQGSTCYLNSVLQVLFMTEDFRERVKKTADTTYIDTELRDLFKDLEKQKAYTRNITNRLNIKNVSVPCDAAEHYEKILRLTSSEASQIFHGKLKNSNKCKQCDTKYDSPAGFWSLPLPLVKNTEEYSVKKGIEDFFGSSEISGDDQMYCEKCDEKCDAVLDCVVEHHPEVLVLLLKRFEFDYEYTFTYVKNQSYVNVPDMLQTLGRQTYKLYAMVEHFGELQYGHYVSTIKSQYDDKWYTFDDSTVTGPSTKAALERSKSAYLLFYRKEIAPKRTRSNDESQESVHVKKPKQELSGEELNFDGNVQKCEDLDTGSSSANTQTIDSQFCPNHQERGEQPNPPEPAHNSGGDITIHNDFETGERFTQTSEFNLLGREAVGAYGSTNPFEDFRPECAQGEGQYSLQSDDKSKIVKLCKGSDNGCDYGSCEGSNIHTTEKQEQNIDQADTTLSAMHLKTEERIERENENDNDTRFPSQHLGSGGNSLDQQTESVKLEVFNCAEKNSNDALPMNASSPVCGNTDEDSVCKQGPESSLLRENSCKNADEKEGEGCTDESSQDRDLKSHPKESFISAEGEKEEKTGSNCTDSIREVLAPCDCSTSVNQNDTEPASSALNRDPTRSVDARERTEKPLELKSKTGVKVLLTKYDLYLYSMKNNEKYESQSNVNDEEKLKKPECQRDEEGNKGDVLSDTQTRGKIQSRVLERRGNDEIIKITLKKSK